MHSKILGLLCCCLLMLAAGCATGGPDGPARRSSAAVSSSPPQPVPPAGMRLGAGYMSALNEPCHELYPMDGTLAQPQAICFRKGSWEVVPAIFMSVPGTGY